MKLNPIGFGYYLKTQTSGFDFIKWEETLFQSPIVKIRPQAKLIEKGIKQ
ncbi:hypothetical protein [Niallia sp. Krafla_26]